MKGYTIQHSIELLEKNQGGGSGGSTTSENVSYDNTGSGLTADNVQEAIDELKADIPTISEYGVNYSATEHLVGSWTDGAPVYESTIHIEALPSAASTGTEYPHGIVNIDKIVDIGGVFTFTGGNTAPIPYAISKADAVTSQIGLVVNDTNIIINVGADRSGVSADVTLRYTKVSAQTNTRSKKTKKEE